MSRDLAHLAPDVRGLCIAMLERGRVAHGIDLLVTCTYRSNAEQSILYAKGRRWPGLIVTNAKPGESLHNVTALDGTPAARAFDVVPLVGGKPVWSTSGPDGDLWQNVGDLGKHYGLEWAGDWKSGREFAHFQLSI